MLLEDPWLTWKDIIPAMQLTMNAAVPSAHTFTHSQLILSTTACLCLPNNCHLPHAIPHPALTDENHLEQLQSALAASQRVVQHYLATPAS